MNIYFAHDRSIYDSDKEAEILWQILAKYPKAIIFNPAKIIQNSRTLDNCLNLIDKSDLVVITPIAETMYGYTLHRGQSTELLYAMSLGIPIEVFYP